jgi:hypothetical protein
MRIIYARYIKAIDDETTVELKPVMLIMLSSKSYRLFRLSINSGISYASTKEAVSSLDDNSTGVGCHFLFAGIAPSPV